MNKNDKLIDAMTIVTDFLVEKLEEAEKDKETFTDTYRERVGMALYVLSIFGIEAVLTDAMKPKA